MDILIIGAGLSGAVMANRFAEAGKKVLIMEKTEGPGGLLKEEIIEGITTQKHGAFVFRSNDERVVDYMSDYWVLNNYKPKYEAIISGKLLPIPFNFKGIDRFWIEDSEYIKKTLIDKYGKDARINVNDLMQSDNEILKEVGKFIFRNLYKSYFEKVWSTDFDKLDPKLTLAIPIVTGYGTELYLEKYQGLPKEGYIPTIKKLLRHKNIKVMYNQDARHLLETQGTKIFFNELEVECPIIWTGQIDIFLNFKFGTLPYISSTIDTEVIDEEQYLTSSVEFRPSHPTISNFIEFKKMTHEQVRDVTVIGSEYQELIQDMSQRFNIPTSPMITEKARTMFNKYKEDIAKWENFYLLGRIATYRNIKMDQVIKEALELADKLLK